MAGLAMNLLWPRVRAAFARTLEETSP
jgi:hypothetical protein